MRSNLKPNLIFHFNSVVIEEKTTAVFNAGLFS